MLQGMRCAWCDARNPTHCALHEPHAPVTCMCGGGARARGQPQQAACRGGLRGLRTCGQLRRAGEGGRGGRVCAGKASRVTCRDAGLPTLRMPVGAAPLACTRARRVDARGSRPAGLCGDVDECERAARSPPAQAVAVRPIRAGKTHARARAGAHAIALLSRVFQMRQTVPAGARLSPPTPLRRCSAWWNPPTLASGR